MRLASLRTAAAAALAPSGPLAIPQDDSNSAGAALGWGPREIRQRPLGRREDVGPFHGPVHPCVDGPRGELFLREGLRAEAEPLMKGGERRIRAGPGPDAWTEALYAQEAVARLAREAGDGDIAAHTAEQMREHDPAHAGTHYAIALVAEQRGDTAAATRELVAAVPRWKDTDPDLAVPSEARPRAAKAGVADPSAKGGSSR
jgi:hypothetical protein